VALDGIHFKKFEKANPKKASKKERERERLLMLFNVLSCLKGSSSLKQAASSISHPGLCKKAGTHSGFDMLP